MIVTAFDSLKLERRLWVQHRRPELVALQVSAKLQNAIIVFDDELTGHRWTFMRDGGPPRVGIKDVFLTWGQFRKAEAFPANAV